MDQNSYLDKLNPQQREAVLYCDGPQLIIAGAGSGKTRVLTYKIMHLLSLGYEPYRIMALTFTNKAAREMRQRIEALVGPDVASRLWMGTFHSIFSHLLRNNAQLLGYKRDFTIYDTSDSRSLVKLIVKDMGLDDKVYKPNNIHARISKLKNDLFLPEDYLLDQRQTALDKKSSTPLFGQIYKTYCDRCRVAGAMDFDDLLVNTNILLRDYPEVLHRYQEFFQYILVDEYQDTNFAQHLIVLKLSRLHRRMSVVGDDAQSIYSFRGANIGNILTLSKQYPDLKTFKLEHNYRSTQTIINAANSLIDKNRNQIKKNIFTDNKKGSLIPVIRCFSDFEEGYVVASQITSIKARTGCRYNDIAVLYRTNAQSRVLEQALSKGGRADDHALAQRGIPYRIYGGLSFYQRKEIKDAIAYFRLTVNHDDDEALRRIINFPTRGIGSTTLDKVQHCAVTAQVSLWSVITDPVKYQLNVNKGTLNKLADFVHLIEGFAKIDSEGATATEVAQAVISRTGLMSMLLNDNTPENISKRENLEELINAVSEFVDSQAESGSDDVKMTNFLAVTSLLTDQDEEKKNGGDCVTLMTVHAAKGLEFKHVIIVGVEKDLFPSAMSSDTLAGIEEERRLLYVAITRAMENCVITYASSRYRNGQTVQCQPSQFISDIDPQYLKVDFRIKERKPDDFSDSYDSFGYRRQQAASKTTFTARTETSRTSPPPGFKRYDPSSTGAVASPMDGDFTLHTADELTVGMAIIHNRFGEGQITKVDTSGSDAKIVAKFDADGIERTMLLKFAKFKIV